MTFIKLLELKHHMSIELLQNYISIQMKLPTTTSVSQYQTKSHRPDRLRAAAQLSLQYPSKQINTTEMIKLSSLVYIRFDNN